MRPGEASLLERGPGSQRVARKAGDPKVRYIGFRVEAPEPLPRQAMIQAIQATGRATDAVRFEAAGVWLTRFDGKRGVLRCAHPGAGFAREVLNAVMTVPVSGRAIPVTIQTVGTSGTIRALTLRDLPDLEDAGSRRR